MIKNKLASVIAIVGLAVSFNTSAMTNQSLETDDYDVAMVKNAPNLGNISVDEEVKLNSPDDYNVSEVYRAKSIRNAKTSTHRHNDLNDVDDY